MALKQIAPGAWVDIDAIGAVTNKVDVKDQVRIEETRILSKTAEELYVLRTERPTTDMFALRYTNETHRIILKALGISDDPSIRPDVKE